MSTSAEPPVEIPVPSAFTERQFRDTLAQFATGIAIICAPAGAGRYAGFTCNSFGSVSLDPPLVLWSLDWRASTLPVLERADGYTVNILAHDQVDLAYRFSRSHEDRFAGVRYRLGETGAPLIDGCIAWLECRRHLLQRIGDHILFVAAVERCARRAGRGLVFAHGGFAVSQPMPTRASEP